MGCIKHPSPNGSLWHGIRTTSDQKNIEKLWPISMIQLKLSPGLFLSSLPLHPFDVFNHIPQDAGCCGDNWQVHAWKNVLLPGPLLSIWFSIKFLRAGHGKLMQIVGLKLMKKESFAHLWAWGGPDSMQVCDSWIQLKHFRWSKRTHQKCGYELLNLWISASSFLWLKF